MFQHTENLIAPLSDDAIKIENYKPELYTSLTLEKISRSSYYI